MNTKLSLPLMRTALCAALSLSILPKAHAQFTYTFYPNNTKISGNVSTDYAIVGYAGGGYDPNDFSRHFTSPSSPTVQVVDGANIANEMDIFNHSVVNVAGGNVGALIPYDNSTVNISGGQSGFVLSIDQSVINVRGGNVDDLEGQGKQINVSGGTVGTLVANENTDYMGNPLGSCLVKVTGGSIAGEVDAFNDGILDLYGGQFGGDLYARFGGTIHLFGNGLTASLINPNYKKTYSLYSLSGTLADGSVLTNERLFVENDGVTYGHSSFQITNGVPEPGSVALLLGLGVSGAGMWRRRKKQAVRL